MSGSRGCPVSARLDGYVGESFGFVLGVESLKLLFGWDIPVSSFVCVNLGLCLSVGWVDWFALVPVVRGDFEVVPEGLGICGEDVENGSTCGGSVSYFVVGGCNCLWSWLYREYEGNC